MLISGLFCCLVLFSFLLFFTQDRTPHILRFYLLHTVIAPAAPQESVGEAGIEPGTAALQSGVTQLP
jgi:hypothetical protein